MDTSLSAVTCMLGLQPSRRYLILALSMVATGLGCWLAGVCLGYSYAINSLTSLFFLAFFFFLMAIIPYSFIAEKQKGDQPLPRWLCGWLLCLATVFLWISVSTLPANSLVSDLHQKFYRPLVDHYSIVDERNRRLKQAGFRHIQVSWYTDRPADVTLVVWLPWR